MKKTEKCIGMRYMGAVLCVLCVLWVMVSCSSPSSSENDGEAKPIPPEATGPDDDGQDTTGEGGGGTGNTDSIFKLHCFTKLEDGTVLFSGEDAYGTIEDAAKVQYKFAKEAQDYIVDKFAALQKKMQAENPTENTFKTVLNDAINLADRQGDTYNTPYRLCKMLDRGIPAFYQETAKYIAQIVNSLDGDDQAKFRACYDHLAVQAYEKSLTVTNNPALVTVNEDKPEIKTELSNLDIADQDVEKTLIALLEQVAAKQSITAETLKDSVNLALDIDGLYGLHDSVYIRGGGYRPGPSITTRVGMILVGVNISSPPRARYQYDPSLYGDYDTYPKPMFGNMLNDELAKLQMQTQSYEMGR